MSPSYQGKVTTVKKDLKIIYCIVARNEMIKMKELIHTIDPKAFITITEAHEILGEGFTFVNEETS